MSESRYRKRGERSDKGRIDLTERDIDCMGWVGEQYCVRLDIVQALLSRHERTEREITDRRMRKIIDRWMLSGYAKKDKILVGPGWVWLTSRGLRLVGLPYRVYEPSVTALEHLHAISRIRMRVEQSEKYHLMEWKPERELRYRLEQWLREAREQGRTGHRNHLPDAELVSEQERIGIEVELTAKSVERTRAIMQDLIGRYDKVWYFVSKAARASIERAWKGLDGTAQIKVGLQEYGDE